jgi:hypothetical protein
MIEHVRVKNLIGLLLENERKFAAIWKGRCAMAYAQRTTLRIILAALNLSTFHSWQQNLDAVFIINDFKSKISSPYVSNSVYILVHAMIIIVDSLEA